VSAYQAWTAKLESGDEVLISLDLDDSIDGREYFIEGMSVAFRDVWAKTWGPPVTLERAP
jgi:hypothetical protein